jgi:hypothetical protein
MAMMPQALGVKGSTQPEIFRGTVDAMVQQLRADADRFWQESLARDGPIDIWVIRGERFLYNGNHRFHAASQAGVEIPSQAVRITDMTATTIPTFLLENVVWLSGFK